MVAIPIAFFVLLELGLQLAGYGKDYRLFIRQDGLVPGMYYLNPDLSHKYFGDLEGTVFFRDASFKAVKPSNGFRVFVLGGSSVQGFPYAQSASFPSHLQRRLNLLYPDRYIEVVNLGASAVNSHTLLDILPEVLAQQPDLLLIYAGHNEYYGALGAASSRSFGGSRAFTKLMLRLYDFKTVALIRDAIGLLSPSRTTSSKSLMQSMIGESHVPFSSDTYQRGITQFEGNMHEVLEAAREAKVPVLIGTLASNLRDHRPFASAKNDEENALAYFEKGNLQLQNGDSIGAKASLEMARELDELRFRAPAAINKTIIGLSRQYQVPLVKIDSIFDANSPKGITGANLMCDHLHPNLEGYFLMGKSYFDALLHHGFLPPSPLEIPLPDSILRATFPFTRFDSTHAHNQLVYLLGSYPFVPAGTPNPLIGSLRNVDLVDKLTTEANTDSARSIVALHYLKNQNYRDFRKEMSVMLSYLPGKEHPYMNTILLLTREGLIREAYPHINEILKSLPENASTLKMRGMYHAFQGDHQMAITQWEKAIAMRPEDPDLYNQLGFSRYSMGNLSRALADYDQCIRLRPKHENAHHNRGVVKYQMKDFEGAVADLDKVINWNKNNSLAWLIRGYAKMNLKNKQGACEDWRHAAQMGVKDAQALIQHCR